MLLASWHLHFCSALGPLAVTAVHFCGVGVHELRACRAKWQFVLEAILVGGFTLMMGTVIDCIGYGRCLSACLFCHSHHCQASLASHTHCNHCCFDQLQDFSQHCHLQTLKHSVELYSMLGVSNLECTNPALSACTLISARLVHNSYPLACVSLASSKKSSCH